MKRNGKNQWDRKNWWDYHKWYVLIGIGLAVFLFQRMSSAFGWFERRPDLQIAYVAQHPLPQDTAAALTDLFSGLAGDMNRDGRSLVVLHQYTADADMPSGDAYYYQYASEVELIADISSCESYLLLTDDPQDLQRRFQILAMPDGTAPAETDFDTEGKCFRWGDCPLLAGPELGEYTDTHLGESVTGNNQDLLRDLYLGRRCFYETKTVLNPEECNDLWNRLVTGLAGQTI